MSELESVFASVVSRLGSSTAMCHFMLAPDVIAVGTVGSRGLHPCTPIGAELWEGSFYS